MKKNSELNMKCRTCFNDSKDFKSLKTIANNQKQKKTSYAEMLKEVANIDVIDKKYREMPKFICRSCSCKLKTAHAFVQKAQETNDKLWSILYKKDYENHQPDCLEETQIDLEACLQIKIENIQNEGSLEDKLQNYVELKLENEEDCILTNNKTTTNSNDLTNAKSTEVISLQNPSDANTSEILENNVEDNLLMITNLTKLTANETKPIEIISLKTSVDSDALKCNLINSDSVADIFKPTVEMSDSDYEDNDDQSIQSDDTDWQAREKLSSKKNVKKKNSSSKTDISIDDNNIDIAVPCNICNKIFVNSKALATHQRISHIPEEQKCTCTICSRKFTRYCNMYKHMRTFHGPESVTLIRKPADGENVFKCEKCPKKYAKKKSLSHHIKIKHSNLPKKSSKISDDTKKPIDKGSLCPICGSSFTSKTQLTVHIRRHTGERPFKCDLCDRAFLLATHLTSHKRLHTGEKPFKCKLCGKAFRVSGKLAQHMRSHSDIRPYKCSQCERSFKYSQDLNIHVRSHTGERPYKCADCGSAFQRYNTLRDHRMRMGHMENSTEPENKLLNNLTSRE